MWRSPRGARLAVAPLVLLAPSLLSPAAPAADVPLTLDEAVRLAVTRNERALASGERLAAAEARVSKAKAFFFPDLSAKGSYVRRASTVVSGLSDSDLSPQRLDVLTASATARQVLFDARALPLYRAARSDRDAARLEASEDRRSVARDAATAFLQTLALEQAAAAADRRAQLAAESLADARARFEAQIVGSNDVTRAALEQATADREKVRARNDVETALLALSNLLNAPLSGDLAPPRELLAEAEAGAPAADALVDEARGRRLDVAAKVKRAEALRFAAQEPMSRFYPSVTARADYGFTNDLGPAGRQTSWTWGLDLTWSIFDSGIRFADKAEREALARAASLDAKAQARAVELDVRTALASLGNARAAVQQANVALEAARKNAAETTTLYREGLSTAFAVADANQRLFEADVALVRERLGLALAVVDLRAARGLDPLGKEPTP